jgi:hypothetical protein
VLFEESATVVDDGEALINNLLVPLFWRGDGTAPPTPNNGGAGQFAGVAGGNSVSCKVVVMVWTGDAITFRAGAPLFDGDEPPSLLKDRRAELTLLLETRAIGDNCSWVCMCILSMLGAGALLLCVGDPAGFDGTLFFVMAKSGW